MPPDHPGIVRLLAAGEAMSEARVGDGPDGQCLITWDFADGRHWEAEIFPDGRVELFFLDRRTDETHEAETMLTPAFWGAKP